MCHQSVGLIARHLEAAGLPTVTLSSARTITAAVRPPRSVFVDFPLGHTAGPPGDPAAQAAVVSAALDCLETAAKPGTIVDLDLTWPGGPGWKREDAGETRKPRDDTPQYQHDDDRVAAEAAHRAGRCRACIGIDG
ncbi:hypothetical protein SAMN06272737_111113 [Blastococcus mobilis]|uniref:Uncharacterized protein n=1 Tax=Blastococcus mobilis TaxID=1938746 RepID=A0A238X3N1_9ACTN|nr:hypothetical protein SAMN06272737_111113 [Blastococcus mobilis]